MTCLEEHRDEILRRGAEYEAFAGNFLSACSNGGSAISILSELSGEMSQLLRETLGYKDDILRGYARRAARGNSEDAVRSIDEDIERWLSLLQEGV